MIDPKLEVFIKNRTQRGKLTPKMAVEFLTAYEIEKIGLSAVLEMIENSRQGFTNDKAVQRAKSRCKYLYSMLQPGDEKGISPTA